MRKKKEKKPHKNDSLASSSIISLKGQDFVDGIGKSRELQMQRTAGYFPLPWPAKESCFKTHLPVNILAWLWVIAPVWTRPSRAWRCTCTEPSTDSVTLDFTLRLFRTSIKGNCCDCSDCGWWIVPSFALNLKLPLLESRMWYVFTQT